MVDGDIVIIKILPPQDIILQQIFLLMMDYGLLFLVKKLTVMMDLLIKQQMDMDLVIIIKLIRVLPYIGKDQMLQLLIMLGLYLPVIHKFKSINRLI